MIVLEDALLTAPDVNHPVIGAFPLSGDITASSAAPGFDAAFAADPSTIMFWRPTSLPATWDLEFAAADVSYVGIAAHDLASVGATVTVQVDEGAGFETVTSHAPADNSPILFLLAEREAVAVRLQFTGAGAVPTIGIIMIGEATAFPQRAAYVGRKDFQDQIAEEFTTNQSDGGNFLGRYVARRRQAVNLSVSHLSEDWKADVLDDLIGYLTHYPGFVADRPLSAPKSVIFGYLAEKPIPERNIPNRAASVSVSMDFIGHVA